MEAEMKAQNFNKAEGNLALNDRDALKQLRAKNSRNPYIEDYLDYLMAQKGYSDCTIMSYKYDLVWLFRYYKIRNNLVDENVYKNQRKRNGEVYTDYTLIDISDVGLKDLKNIKFPDLYAFIGFSARELNNTESSRKRKVSTLKGFFRFLHVVKNEISEDPTEALEAPRIAKSLPHFLTLEQAQDLIEAPNGGKYEARDKAILIFFLNLGLRVSELCSLELGDLKAEILHIRGKGKKDREIMLSDSCLQALALYLPERAEHLERRGLETNVLFISQKGTKFTSRGIEHLVEKYVKQIGLDPRGCTVHTLRHTAATLMHTYGEDIRSIQEVLGHESTATTEIYTHLDSKVIRDAINANPLTNYKIDDSVDLSEVFEISKNTTKA